MKRPDWTRNEIILALNLYFRLGYGQMDGRNQDVVRLSQILRLMDEAATHDKAFRSVNSVALKLANFKRIDPQFKGKGMKGGAKIENEVWTEFAKDKSWLSTVAKSFEDEIIKKGINVRKQAFKKWFNTKSQPNGKPYQVKTIGMYANWVEKSIAKEFKIDLHNVLGLYGVDSIKDLTDIEARYLKGDTKRKKDFISGFHSYLRFVTDSYSFDWQQSGEQTVRTEGGVKVYVSTVTERDPQLRLDAMRIHGMDCMVCGFNFQRKFGEWGKNFIEVHHLVPLSEKRKRATDPAKDLVVLCSNCHRMIHRKQNIVLTIDEIKTKCL